MKKWLILIVLVAVLSIVAGCVEETPPVQQSTPAPTPAVKQTTLPQTTVPVTTVTPVATLTVSETTVTIMDNTFTPSELTIKVHSQVRWTNGDPHPHRVEFANGGFTAFLLGPSQSSSQQFDRPGIYDYTCKIFPTMKGKITVVA